MLLYFCEEGRAILPSQVLTTPSLCFYNSDNCVFSALFFLKVHYSLSTLSKKLQYNRPHRKSEVMFHKNGKYNFDDAAYRYFLDMFNKDMSLQFAHSPNYTYCNVPKKVFKT